MQPKGLNDQTGKRSGIKGDVMLQTTIRLASIGDVKAFVNIARQYPFKIDLISGRYCVTGKSMMGIFCLDLSKDIFLEAYTDEETLEEEFLRQLQPFITKISANSHPGISV